MISKIAFFFLATSALFWNIPTEPNITTVFPPGPFTHLIPPPHLLFLFFPLLFLSPIFLPSTPPPPPPFCSDEQELSFLDFSDVIGCRCWRTETHPKLALITIYAYPRCTMGQNQVILRHQ